MGFTGLQRATRGYKGFRGLRYGMVWYGMVSLFIHGISFRHIYIEV